MKILIFFSRIALICNICFVIAELMKYSANLRLNDVYATVVVLGYASIILNIVLGLTVLAMLGFKKLPANSVPRWLLITNFLFLIVQLFIFLS